MNDHLGEALLVEQTQECRIGVHRFFEIFGRLLPLALPCPYLAAVEEGLRVTRIEAHGSTIVSNRLVIVALECLMRDHLTARLSDHIVTLLPD